MDTNYANYVSAASDFANYHVRNIRQTERREFVRKLMFLGKYESRMSLSIIEKLFKQLVTSINTSSSRKKLIEKMNGLLYEK